MHLTAEQDGIYRRLIDFYMEIRQPISDSDNALARAAGIDMQQWLLHSPVIRAFFISSERGFLRHKRCDIELDRQDERSRGRSVSGKKGAEKRWNKNKENQNANSKPNGIAIADPMANDSIGQEKREVSKKKEVSKKTTIVVQKAERFGLIELPSEWGAFCAVKRPGLDPQEVFQQFSDYWTAKPGKDATKLDWFATWRNWIRNQNQQNKGYIQVNKPKNPRI